MGKAFELSIKFILLEMYKTQERLIMFVGEKTEWILFFKFCRFKFAHVNVANIITWHKCLCPKKMLSVASLFTVTFPEAF